MADNVHQLNPQISLNLDTLERETSKKPFTFGGTVKGENGEDDRQVVLSFKDPADVEFVDLATLESPIHLLRFVLDEDQREDLVALKLPSWKFQKLMEAYMAHYGLDVNMGKGRLW